MGLVKTIYNVLGGFTWIIIALIPQKVCTNLTKKHMIFCALFYLPFLLFPYYVKICIKKPSFFNSVLFFILSLQTMLQILLSKSFLFLKEVRRIDPKYHDVPK